MKTLPDYTKLPFDSVLRETFQLYIEEGYDPGHFVTAVLTNDLFEAVSRADIYNEKRIPEIVRWVYQQAPTGCYGDKEKVRQWRHQRGLRGA